MFVSPAKEARRHLQELDVPGEALVQGRKIGFREGSHLAKQLYHYRCQRKEGKTSAVGGGSKKKKETLVVKGRKQTHF